MNRLGPFALAAVASFLLLPGSPAAAAVVSIDITADVALVDDPFGVLAGQVTVGQAITGRYRYDSTVPDTNPLPTVGDYWQPAPYGLRVIAGNLAFFTVRVNNSFLIELVNDHGTPASDNYLLRSYNNHCNNLSIGVEHMAWQLDDPTLGALSSTVLPTTPPVLEDWQSIFGLTVEGFSIAQPEHRFFIRAHVTSAVLTP